MSYMGRKKGGSGEEEISMGKTFGKKKNRKKKKTNPQKKRKKKKQKTITVRMPTGGGPSKKDQNLNRRVTTKKTPSQRINRVVSIGVSFAKKEKVIGTLQGEGGKI